MKLKIMHFDVNNERVKDGVETKDKRKQRKYIEKLFSILSLDEDIVIEIDDYSFTWFTKNIIVVSSSISENFEEYFTFDEAKNFALSLIFVQAH
jgi:hypothetical protein